MPHKSITTFATIISALGLLAGAALAAPEQQAQTAARECHDAPKGAAPEGAHWYYKTNRSTGKKCWYLADKVAKTKKATTTASTQSADRDDEPAKSESRPEPKAEARAEKKAGKSVADARAEVFADKPSAEPEPTSSASSVEDKGLAESVWPALPDKSETDTAASPAASSTDTDAGNAGAFASRWPDQVSNAAPVDAKVLLASKQAEQQHAAIQPQPAATSTVGRTNAAMADEPAESSVSTMGLLLSVLAGLLALAAIIGPAIFKRIRPQQEQPSTPRRGIWDDVDADNPPMPWDAAQDVQNDNKSREAQDLDAQNGDLQKILQRISRPAA
jgi:hypothetical protein